MCGEWKAWLTRELPWSCTPEFLRKPLRHLFGLHGEQISGDHGGRRVS
jgi:hypothetical protein